MGRMAYIASKELRILALICIIGAAYLVNKIAPQSSFSSIFTSFTFFVGFGGYIVTAILFSGRRAKAIGVKFGYYLLLQFTVGIIPFINLFWSVWLHCAANKVPPVTKNPYLLSN